jgi:hypothetical protein
MARDQIASGHFSYHIMDREIRIRPGLHRAVSGRVVGSEMYPWLCTNASALEDQTAESRWAQGAISRAACIGCVQRLVLILVLPYFLCFIV